MRHQMNSHVALGSKPCVAHMARPRSNAQVHQLHVSLQVTLPLEAVAARLTGEALLRARLAHALAHLMHGLLVHSHRRHAAEARGASLARHR